MKSSTLFIACIVAGVAAPAGARQPSATITVDASPVLAWNRIALETIERARPSQHVAVRLLTQVSLAQHAAFAEAADPEAAGAAVATASKHVIAQMFPAQAAFAESRFREAGARPSEQGERIARRVLAQAATDGFSEPWRGELPQGPHAWRSLAQPAAAPAYPAIGRMRTLLLDAGSMFRPGPPPAVDSPRFASDLEQVRGHAAAPTDESRRIARFYDMTTGTLAGGYWNEQAGSLLRRHEASDHRATVVFATVNAAMMDALVACHDAKYAYWVPRPSQVDPSIRPLIGVPNHPSYPSNHSCLSTAAGQVLAFFFPAERGRLAQAASEAGLSRIYAGIHYRFDVEAGESIGRKVAEMAIARHAEMLARLTQVRVSGF